MYLLLSYFWVMLSDVYWLRNYTLIMFQGAIYFVHASEKLRNGNIMHFFMSKCGNILLLLLLQKKKKIANEDDNVKRRSYFKSGGNWRMKLKPASLTITLDRKHKLCPLLREDPTERRAIGHWVRINLIAGVEYSRKGLWIPCRLNPSLRRCS